MLKLKVVTLFVIKYSIKFVEAARLKVSVMGISWAGLICVPL